MGLLKWKLVREINRIRQQLRGIPEFFSEPAQRRQHDAQRSVLLEPQHGDVAKRKKIALLLVYQPQGVADSTRWTCEHLVAKGYSPLIISNAPLSAADRQMLAPWVWRMAERPNFGYDFGGYRDGIWLLQQWQIAPETLIVLNDSIWFPLTGNETLIDCMEGSSADFVGALQLDPLRQVEGIPRKKRPFFGSFFLMFKRNAWEHSAFRMFWSGYENTSNKYKTIRRGERGLSHALMDAGVSYEAIYTRSGLDAYLGRQSNHALVRVLQQLVTIDERLETQIADAVIQFDSSPEWRNRALELAMAATEKQNILATAPIASLSVFAVPYLKKSRDWNNLKALYKVRDAMLEGSLPIAHASIMNDLNALLD
ncbi:rhamnan synthesis F family protein [Hydrogenophaga sp.]|uniref:rhamnan synthesis F family protein n=1 Tax=Hydrogenophaga sp. TaxID=1904254 RepID=UPI0025C6FA34|nr:rhamnan synthesis F family protein [Hydrogenophaga sp.]